MMFFSCCVHLLPQELGYFFVRMMAWMMLYGENGKDVEG